MVARQFGPEYYENPGCQYVVKAQVQAEGRSKGIFVESGLKGGVHKAHNV